MRLRFKKGDIAAIAAVLLAALALVLLLPKEKQGSTVVIYQNGEKLQELSLYTNESLTVGGAYNNHIVISGGEVYVAESDCPGEDCVHQGKLSSAGSIICLPNRVEIRVEGESSVDTSTN